MFSEFSFRLKVEQWKPKAEESNAFDFNQILPPSLEHS